MHIPNMNFWPSWDFIVSTIDGNSSGVSLQGTWGLRFGTAPSFKAAATGVKRVGMWDNFERVHCSGEVTTVSLAQLSRFANYYHIHTIPLLRQIPSGSSSMTFSAGYAAGTTVSLHPWDASWRRMLCLMPKSWATTCSDQN